MLLAVNPTPVPNMKKLISFLYSIPASNAYVESVLSEMKHLFHDSDNQMSVDSIAAELKIRRNTSLSCTDMYKHLLSQKDLLAAISSNQRWASQRFLRFKSSQVIGIKIPVKSSQVKSSQVKSNHKIFRPG